MASESQQFIFNHFEIIMKASSILIPFLSLVRGQSDSTDNFDGGDGDRRGNLRERRDDAIESNDVSLLISSTEAPARNTSGSSQAFFTSRMGCGSNKKKVKMDILVDEYGAETTWVLEKVNDNSNMRTVVMSNSRTYDANDSEVQEMCLDVGQYELVISDGVGDGICCQYGDGYYDFYIEDDGGWNKVILGGNFKQKKIVHSIQIRVVDPPLSDRDEQWLVAHNTRRKYWHEYYEKNYVPLKWSAELAESSRVYAEKLLDACDDYGIIHDPDNSYGENMAKNKGTGGWGEEYHPDKLVGRFVDREVGLPWPANAHLTQALWRASKYVGCADASKDWNGGTCRTQVCRYSKPGNCGMTSDWEEKVLQDDSSCYPECPPEGCF
mmetsp:Transcript_115/g.185  ORF Transcript_115/g.185 Transcript_115/m.185 type:complete len:381 (+) Transcript_115:82-1224(+)